MSGQHSNLDALRDQYLHTQLAGDRRAALQFIEGALRAGHSVASVRASVVQAAQREIGRLWQEDRISIAQEHLATAISQLALAHLFQHSEFRARLGRKILVACVPGEQHDLPARLFADALDVDGYDVRFLGADVPLPDLLDAIAIERPDLLALSVTMVFNLPSLRETLQRVRAANPRLRIAVGGHAAMTAGGSQAAFGDGIVAGSSDELLASIGQWLRGQI
jgi:MerR family transcriptional regulator, light-induced transcriptional regulator